MGAMAITVTPCMPGDAAELAEVAAVTFPLACPESVPASDVRAFIAEHLSARCFAGYLTDPARRLLAVRHDGRIVGYAMLVGGDDGAVELSKFYLLPDHHGTGTAAQLLDAVVARAREVGVRALRLGVNQNNQRAQRFYRKHGFDVTGTRTFVVGSDVQDDYIMSRAL